MRLNNFTLDPTKSMTRCEHSIVLSVASISSSSIVFCGLDDINYNIIKSLKHNTTGGNRSKREHN